MFDHLEDPNEFPIGTYTPTLRAHARKGDAPLGEQLRENKREKRVFFYVHVSSANIKTILETALVKMFTFGMTSIR